MTDRKQNLIEEVVKLLDATSKKFGYTVISVQTLKEIMSAYSSMYGSPSTPTLSSRETLRPKIRITPRPAPLTFTCTKCRSVKLVSEAAVVISRSDRIGCCKDCEKIKDNIVLFKKR